MNTMLNINYNSPSRPHHKKITSNSNYDFAQLGETYNNCNKQSISSSAAVNLTFITEYNYKATYT